MTFEGQYLTYAEYTNLIESTGGSAMAEMPFNLLEFEARKQIDLRTLKRLVEIEEIPEEVKLCDFHLINKIEKYAESMNSIGGNIKSENTDGYSISYATASEIGQIVVSKSTELEDIIMTDLFGLVVNGEHVIYTGVE